MTEEYRNELLSRITRFNFTNYIYVKRCLRILLATLVFTALGFLLFLPCSYTSGLDSIVAKHFCGFFEDLGTADCIRHAISFAAPDFIGTVLFFVLGFTMFATGGGALALFFYCLRLGFCVSCLYGFLVETPIITNGVSAFAFFCICKVLVLTAIIFMSLSAVDFSYKYRDIYGRRHIPFTSPDAVNYLSQSASICGFTALINIVYLVFQSLQNFTLL